MHAGAQRWRIGGRVQGVGYRPFVYRLALSLEIKGWVRNDAGAVEIHAEGTAQRLQEFAEALLRQAPPAAAATLIDRANASPEACENFAILTSRDGRPGHVNVPVDRSPCEDCLREMRDPAARRFQHPFINCTQCGPRYTIIDRLPYDRGNTTLRHFVLCPQCAQEYAAPLDRRFHAQPLACTACGPRLYWQDAQSQRFGDGPARGAAIAALRGGLIIAVRGIGGYHLMCDAASEAAVALLRTRKGRPFQPFALLVPWQGPDGLAGVRRLARISALEGAALCEPARPIVLVERRADAALAADLAPGLREIGLMLPYSPLHHLLLDDFGAAIVATSGNLSGEPVLIAPDEAQTRLAHVADGFLHHDRPIARPADDPVFRCVAGALRPIRLGRGIAPLNLALGTRLDVPLLAVGAHMKGTVALGWDHRAVVSPHIGDYATPRAQSVMRAVAADLQTLHGVAAHGVAHDAHPDFPSTRWARHSGLPTHPVWHHHAHASAVAGEFPGCLPLLCFTWDGVGLGPDGSLWGGEALLGGPGAWRRVASFRPFRLPGGPAAARQPWRSALALCWTCGAAWPDGERHADPLLRRAFEQRLNAPLTTAVGRLFDAAAALTGVCLVSTYEGEAAMRLEAFCEGPAAAAQLPLTEDAFGVWRSDWAPLIPLLADARRSTAHRAACFHASLARALCEQALAVRASCGVNQIGFAGGVFQNRRLTEAALQLLEDAGFEVLIPQKLPMNDAAISYGQIIEAAANDAPGR